MKIALNKKALEAAKQLIKADQFIDKHGKGDLHHTELEASHNDQFLQSHSWQEYSNWHLGIHKDRPENQKNSYDFNYGDFKLVHRSTLLFIMKKAKEYHYEDIAAGASELIDLIDKKVNHHS